MLNWQRLLGTNLLYSCLAAADEVAIATAIGADKVEIAKVTEVDVTCTGFVWIPQPL